MDLFLSFVFLLIVLAIFFYVNFYRKKWQLINKIPGPDKVHPIYGNFEFPISMSRHHNWSYQCLEWVNNLSKQFGNEGAMRLWAGPVTPLVVLTKPETAQVVLSSHTMTEKGFIYNVFKYFLGSGLGTSRSTRWRYNRKLLNPAFNYNVLQNFLPIINSQQSVLMNVIGQKLANRNDGIIADIRPLISYYVLDTVCETAMGYQLNSQVTEKCDYLSNLHHMFELASYICIRPWFWVSMTLTRMTKVCKSAEQCIQKMRSFTDHVIEQRMLEPHADQLVFLDILLEHHRQYPDKLSLYHIRSEVDTIMFAGHHTNGSSIVWTLLLIGSHPHVQQKIHEELDAVMGESDSVIDMDKLRDMKYLEACVRESLRLYPVAPFIARQTSYDLQCGQYVIPEDTCVVIFIYHIQRREEYWPNADKFIPERFMSNDQSRHSYAFIPFSAGPRSCIGQKYGLMQQKAVLAKILSKYAIKSMIEMSSIQIGVDFVLYPKSEIPIQFELRSK